MRRKICIVVLIAACGVPIANGQSADRATFQRNLQWAQMGQVTAELAVGRDYMRGRVARRNYAAAHTWLQKASDAGSADAKAWRGMMKVTAQGEPRDVQGGLALLNEASAAGSATAKALLGSLYESGKRVSKDTQKSLQLYKEGADAGDSYSMALLGGLYVAADDIPKNEASGKAMLEKSAALGDEWGEVFLADVLAKEAPNEQQMKRIILLYQASAKVGNPEALYKLGTLYEQGTGVAKDLKLARHNYLLAADLDFAPAESALAAMYDLGIGSTVDKVRACFWANLAAAQGDKSSAARVALLKTELSPAELDQVQQHLKDFRSVGTSQQN
jgi:TPR repeat protein